MKFLEAFLAGRSLQGKFLAIAIPLVFVATFALFAVWETYGLPNSGARIAFRLDVMVASQSAALSNPLWNVDETQIALALEAIVIHRTWSALVFSMKRETLRARPALLTSTAPPSAPNTT